MLVTEFQWHIKHALLFYKVLFLYIILNSIVGLLYINLDSIVLCHHSNKQ